mgnify:CR=1 FL=1
MNAFWRFARQMLHYRRLLVYAAAGVLFDTLCAFAGFGALALIIDQLFDTDVTARQLLLDYMAEANVGDWAPWLVDAVGAMPADPFWGFGLLLGLILVLAVLGSFGRFVHQYYTVTISLRTVMRIRKQAYQRLVHLPMRVASLDSTADNLSRVAMNCGSLARGFNTLTNKTIRNILQGIAALGIALWVNWQLSAIFLISVPIIAVLIRKFGKIIRRTSRQAMIEMGRMTGTIAESLQALNVVKVHQTEGYERRRFNRVNKRVLEQEMAARTVRALSSPVIEVIAMAGVMAVALVAAWYLYRSADVQDGRELIKVLVFLGAAGAAFKPVANLNNELQGAAAAAERIDEVLQLDVEPVVHHGSTSRRKRALPQMQRRPAPRHRDTVSFENIGFTYPTGSQPALSEVSLTVEQGSICAIVGSNGSGKSTLVSLLPRLYEPSAGRVLIDGVDIADCSLRSVRSQMAMVTQETVLFDGTIAENIAYGTRHASEKRIREAARRAHADEFINALPEGYDAPIGERGQRLSGGQRQRLAIARAILRDPAILILDEATSQIDADSEAKINDALADFMAERTTFVIAHRLSTVVHADMIVVMADGRIASVGRHEQLLETSDAYRVLCRTQLHASVS